MKQIILTLLLVLTQMAFVGCDKNEPIAGQELINTVWLLDSLWSPTEFGAVENDSLRYRTAVRDVTYLPDGSFVLSIEFDGSLLSVDFCNTGGGSYDIEQAGYISMNSGIELSALYCVGWRDLEEILMEVAREVERYEIDGDQLTLRSQDGSYSAVFTAEQ